MQLILPYILCWLCGHIVSVWLYILHRGICIEQTIGAGKKKNKPLPWCFKIYQIIHLGELATIRFLHLLYELVKTHTEAHFMNVTRNIIEAITIMLMSIFVFCCVRFHAHKQCAAFKMFHVVRFVRIYLLYAPFTRRHLKSSQF